MTDAGNHDNSISRVPLVYTVKFIKTVLGEDRALTLTTDAIPAIFFENITCAECFENITCTEASAANPAKNQSLHDPSSGIAPLKTNTQPQRYSFDRIVAFFISQSVELFNTRNRICVLCSWLQLP